MDMKIISETVLMIIYVELMTLEMMRTGLDNCLHVQCIYSSSLIKNQCYKQSSNWYAIDFDNNDILRFIPSNKYGLCNFSKYFKMTQ